MGPEKSQSNLTEPASHFWGHRREGITYIWVLPIFSRRNLTHPDPPSTSVICCQAFPDDTHPHTHTHTLPHTPIILRSPCYRSFPDTPLPPHPPSIPTSMLTIFARRNLTHPPSTSVIPIFSRQNSPSSHWLTGRKTPSYLPA